MKQRLKVAVVATPGGRHEVIPASRHGALRIT
ncbi:hypothetical protein SAMN05443580_103319 [Variovorax sp. OV084]|jgi:hypothetical protein|nr:hypothetical protein [Variovorax boronicumulans]SET41220.1 hypothetical protein SAMN05443580_103319 [Variovorax sp. OV084]